MAPHPAGELELEEDARDAIDGETGESREVVDAEAPAGREEVEQAPLLRGKVRGRCWARLGLGSEALLEMHRQALEDLLGVLHEEGAVSDQGVGPQRLVVPDPAGDGVDVATELERQAAP